MAKFIKIRTFNLQIESIGKMEKDMKNKEQIIGTAEAWESGELGRIATHTAPASALLAQQIDDALGMQVISIRLPKELIEEYKIIAQVHKLGYQPLMRDALKRFAEAELKKLAVQYVNEKAAKGQLRTNRVVHRPYNPNTKEVLL